MADADFSGPSPATISRHFEPDKPIQCVVRILLDVHRKHGLPSDAIAALQQLASSWQIDLCYVVRGVAKAVSRAAEENGLEPIGISNAVWSVDILMDQLVAMRDLTDALGEPA